MRDETSVLSLETLPEQGQIVEVRRRQRAVRDSIGSLIRARRNTHNLELITTCIVNTM